MYVSYNKELQNDNNLMFRIENAPYVVFETLTKMHKTRKWNNVANLRRCAN